MSSRSGAPKEIFDFARVEKRPGLKQILLLETPEDADAAARRIEPTMAGVGAVDLTTAPDFSRFGAFGVIVGPFATAKAANDIAGRCLRAGAADVRIVHGAESIAGLEEKGLTDSQIIAEVKLRLGGAADADGPTEAKNAAEREAIDPADMLPEDHEAFEADGAEDAAADEEPAEEPDDAAADPQSALPPEFSEDAIALRFSTIHANDLRYVAAWGKWLEWDAARWRADGTLRAYALSRIVCRAVAAACPTASTSKTIASARTVAAVERLARSDHRHAAIVDQWDTDPWLLNTPAGTVDLRTGRMRHHRQEDCLTKITGAAPGGGCPTWIAFLEKITGGDKELVLFLQRVAGYCLTGSTQEHALFFCYGTGGNGKGVFVNTISGIMGDYARTAPMETFVASNNDRHPTELAGLMGARLVTAQETEEGRRWAESKIKSLTGGDTISARFMRQDFFDYTPQFKLLIAGNHKPGLRGVDEAIRRRMNLIPFTVTIPKEERDETLSERLREEWPGILQWMIDGCADWQGEGLQQPEAVRKATDDYLRAEDSIAEWIADRCTIGAQDSASSSALFKNWQGWAASAGEFVGSNKWLSKKLEDRGFVKRETSAGNLFQGIAIIPKSEPPPWEPPL